MFIDQNEALVRHLFISINVVLFKRINVLNQC